MKDTSYLNYIIQDVLSDIPNITYKPMFSGWCLYQNRTVFALIIQNELYFKTNEAIRDELRKRGSHPFSYNTKKREVITSYWLLPLEILESNGKIAEWVNLSVLARKETKK